MTVERVNIRFIIGSREILSVPRRLESVSFTLDHLLGAKDIAMGQSVLTKADGLRILSAPVERFEEIVSQFPECFVGGYQCYRRHFIDMSGDFDTYMSEFSSKTRSTLKRKRRKLEEHCGGALDIREYRTAGELSEFLRLAVPLSRKTYQARHLGAGLPEDQQAQAGIIAEAAADRVRAYLLFRDGQAISYLFLPIRDDILYYDYLGYDPDLASFSPGTVLQMEALERLFGEARYRYFDFTEGEGAHKALFGTASIQACSFFLLKRNMANKALMSSLAAFDGTVARIRDFARSSRLGGRLRSALRA